MELRNCKDHSKSKRGEENKILDQIKLKKRSYCCKWLGNLFIENAASQQAGGSVYMVALNFHVSKLCQGRWTEWYFNTPHIVENSILGNSKCIWWKKHLLACASSMLQYALPLIKLRPIPMMLLTLISYTPKIFCKGGNVSFISCLRNTNIYQQITQTSKKRGKKPKKKKKKSTYAIEWHWFYRESKKMKMEI